MTKLMPADFTPQAAREELPCWNLARENPGRWVEVLDRKPPTMRANVHARNKAAQRQMWTIAVVAGTVYVRYNAD